MRAINFASANVHFGPPSDWDEELNGPCSKLHVQKDVTHGTFTSVWKPSWRERLSVLFGASVVLCIVGGQPPVDVSIQKIDEVKSQPAPAG